MDLTQVQKHFVPRNIIESELCLRYNIVFSIDFYKKFTLGTVWFYEIMKYFLNDSDLLPFSW